MIILYIIMALFGYRRSVSIIKQDMDDRICGIKDDAVNEITSNVYIIKEKMENINYKLDDLTANYSVAIKSITEQFNICSKELENEHRFRIHGVQTDYFAKFDKIYAKYDRLSEEANGIEKELDNL